MNLAGKKILICEEALIDHGGHFQSWIKAIRKMHLDAGATVYVASNQAVLPAVREDLDALPVYSVNSWDQTASSKWSGWRRGLRVFAQNWRVFWETRRVLQRTGPVDMLFFTAVRVHQILGLRALCAWGLGRKFRGLTCFLLTSQAEYNADFTSYHFPRQTRLMALALKSFKRLAERGEVILAGDSHITCGEYEKLAGVPMTHFPSPGSELRYVAEGSTPDAGPIFTILGVSTWDKGIDVFQEAIIRFLDRHPETDARFVLQWRVPCESPKGVVTPISDRLRLDSRVTFLEKRLSNEEYASFFREADFVVLPYRKSTYFNRISGVVVEAALSGKPMLVTEGTWLDWAISEFGSGIAVPENDVAALCAAIEQCCAERTRMTSFARDRIAVALDYNSPGRYLDTLWRKNGSPASRKTMLEGVTSPPLLVTGFPRSGKTTLSQALVRAGRFRRIQEPFSNYRGPDHQSAIIRNLHKTFTYITPSNAWQYRDDISSLLNHFAYSYRVAVDGGLTFKKLLIYLRNVSLQCSHYWRIPLIDDPFLVLSVPWLRETLRWNVVVIIRSPLDSVAARTEQGFGFDFGYFVGQKELLEGPLRSCAREVCEVAEHSHHMSHLIQNAYLWKYIHLCILQYAQQFPEVLLLRFEDMKAGEFDKFAGWIHANYDIDLSAQDNPFPADASAEGDALSEKDKNAVAEITGPVAAQIYATC